MSEYNHRDRSGPCFEKRYLWCTVIVLLISNFRSRANFNETGQVKVSNNFSIRIPQNYTKWSIKLHLRSITYSKINQKGRGPFPKTAVKIVHPLPLMAKSQFLGQWKKMIKFHDLIRQYTFSSVRKCEIKLHIVQLFWSFQQNSMTFLDL